MTASAAPAPALVLFSSYHPQPMKTSPNQPSPAGLRSIARSIALALSLTLAPVAAQGDSSSPSSSSPEAAEAQLNKGAAGILLGFASFARSKKFGPMEKASYELILDQYDRDHPRARSALDYKKEGGEWKLVAPKDRRSWLDKANRKGRYQVQQRWREVCIKLGERHRALGLQLKSDGHPDKGAAQLRRAILYNPLDKESHEALGHKPYENNGITYYGTDSEVAFMKRMKEVETFALTLAKKRYDPKPVTKIPEPLAKTGLTFAGASTEHFTVFVRGTQENADDVVQWGERALDFLEFCVGNNNDRVIKRARRLMKSWNWIGILWTSLEMEQFKKLNPELLRDLKGKYTNINFESGGKSCEVIAINMPSYMHDHLIAHAWHYGLGSHYQNNIGLLEGTHHAATWFLKSTCFTKFGAEPEGTVSSGMRELPEGANWWLREMRNQALGRTDVALNVVPRTQLYDFKPDVRLKTWSFMTWVMARFPNKWLDFVQACPNKPIPFPSKVDELGGQIFEMPLNDVEEQWREWASGRSVTAAATGYGPPLLPEFPNKDELMGLDRLNEVRRAVTCWRAEAGPKEESKKAGTSSTPAVPDKQWNKCMPECELDSEATAACKDHARFFGKHEEHWKWPEAHEEDPAKEGFTPRGMRAGLRSVIIWSNGSLDAKRSIDGWIGTVYHRFPLLEYNVKRFGLAYDGSGKCEVVVLDMGSLQEPRDPVLERNCAFAAWPADGMTNVPRQFAFTEHPNPLEDVGLGFENQKETGYPVSLQFTRLVQQNIGGATMKLYEAKKRGKKFDKGQEVPCWLHTPDKPLLKRLVMRNVVFVIPKAILKKTTLYLASVSVQFGGGQRTYEWTFTTGTQMQGLGRLK